MVPSLWTLNCLVVSLRAHASVHYCLYCMRARFFKSWTNICLAFIVMQMTANFICPSAPMPVLTKMLLWLEWKAVLMIFLIGYWMINWNWTTTRLSFWSLVHPSNSLKQLFPVSVLATQQLHPCYLRGIDYYNSLLYGAPEYQINKLQRVQHMCARLICNESKYCHITSLLMELHWLPIKLRIEF